MVAKPFAIMPGARRPAPGAGRLGGLPWAAAGRKPEKSLLTAMKRQMFTLVNFFRHPAEDARPVVAGACGVWVTGMTDGREHGAEG